jgi:hypothetical protein
MNNDGVTSGATPVSPDPVTTVAGPNNAPAGSIGGISDPSKAVTISGVLPNGRLVTLNVPAGAFPSPTGLAVATSGVSNCDSTPALGTVALDLYSQNALQPEIPLTLTFNYAAGEEGPIDTNATRVVLSRYVGSADCLPLETTVNTATNLVTASINHFSHFELVARPAVSSLTGLRIYPNPLSSNRGVTIEPVPADSTINIYTLSGELVWKGNAGTTGVINWKGVNKAGQQVASGVYLAVINSTAGKKIVKIAVER